MTRRFDTLTIEDVARFPRPGTAIPTRFAFVPNRPELAYLASAEGNLVLSLFALNLDSGDVRLLAGPPSAATDEANLSREEALRRERARLRELGVTSYQFARKADPLVLLVPLAGSLWACVGDGDLAEVPGTAGALDARLDPFGKRVAFVRDGELWVADIPGGNARKLTAGAEEGLTHGVAEFIAAEELDRSEGFWWSPGGDAIAFARADERHIPDYPIVHQGGPLVDVEHHRYPFAGKTNAYVDLAIVDVETGSTRWLDLGPSRDMYLARVTWRPDGVLTAQVLDRAQRSIRLLAFDDAGQPATLLEEATEPWVNLHNDLRFLESGEFMWSSERSGFRHLYLCAGDGTVVRQLTSGDWMVTRLVALDEEGRVAYFEGTKDSVLQRHLYSVSLDGGPIERLTSGDGWHATALDARAGAFVDIHSSAAFAPRVTVRSLDGTERHQLAGDEGMTATSLGLQEPELIAFRSPNGVQLHGALWRPEGEPPYPLVVSVYGGPHAQRVMDDWFMTVDLRAQYLVREGFAVLRVDNRGSANRGLAFEAELHRRMGTVEVEDQAAAVRELVARGLVDPARVGIFGWSYGGYMTLMAMLLEPELFRVGVAGAPVSDWDGYDTGYTERYMGTPQDNPEGYRAGSALTHAAKLEGKLLLVHGGVDENVHFRHTARFITALTAAGKDYDLLLFPSERHMPRDAKGLEYQERHLIEFFKRHL